MLSVGADEGVLVVRHRAIIVALSLLEIVGTLPSKWTVVSDGDYAVCPVCAERVAVGTLPERMSCEQCGGDFEFELKRQDIPAR